mmetsp:Transcript_36522/g.66941  ORF Transcript_36522/g.66941 Transcript_36522/m.66941 type:complete len:282 (-) Transcript_36522:61-906(-)
MSESEIFCASKLGPLMCFCVRNGRPITKLVRTFGSGLERDATEVEELDEDLLPEQLVKINGLESVDAALFGHIEECSESAASTSLHPSLLPSTALHLDHFDRASMGPWPPELGIVGGMQRADSCDSDDVDEFVNRPKVRSSGNSAADPYMTAGVCNTPSRGSMDSLDSDDSFEAVNIARARLAADDDEEEDPVNVSLTGLSGLNIGMSELDSLVKEIHDEQGFKAAAAAAESALEEDDLEWRVQPDEALFAAIKSSDVCGVAKELRKGRESRDSERPSGLL